VIRKLLIRLGLLKATLALTCLSILISVLLAGAISSLTGRKPSQVSIWIAIIVPAIIAPIYSLPFLRVLIRLDGAEHRLQELTRRDGLTGLYNRAHFIELAEREMERTLRYGEPFSIAILDIDEFKQVNDSYGHLTGDKVLQALGQVLLGNMRQTDIVARYGGDEFVALLPNTREKNVQDCVERIRKTLAGTPVVCEGGVIRITVSAGTATYSNRYTELDLILQQADNALCEAKRLGKNQFVIGYKEEPYA
jgi:diguanylate cyclase (GGDEF)-like protein